MVTGEIIGVNRLLSFTESMRSGVLGRLRREMQRQSINLQTLVKTGYLKGQALNVGKTGLLHNSITQKVTESEPGHLVGIVGTNVKYGCYWELGFDRRVGAGARGGPRSITSEVTLAKYFMQHPAGTKHYNARPFLAPALMELAPSIRAALEAALTQGMNP